MDPQACGLDGCIKCTICTQVCPVAQRSPLYPGPKAGGPDAERFRRTGHRDDESWTDLCSGCKLCELACPSGVRVAGMNLDAKSVWVRKNGLSPVTRLLVNAERLNRLSAPFAGLQNPVLAHPLLRKALEAGIGLNAQRPLPRNQRDRFRRWARERQKRRKPVNGLNAEQIAYFFGCYTDSHAPSIGKTVVKCLEALGCAVEFPRQGCCGIARIASGDWKGAEKIARRNTRWMNEVFARGIPVLFSSPSCGLALKHEYEVLFHSAGTGYLPQARFCDVFEFLLDFRDQAIRPGALEPVPARVYYHAACHLKALGIGFPAVEILRRIPALEVILLDTGCCGLAGTFGFKQDRYPLSMKMGSDLLETLRRVSPDFVVSECEGCRMQIEHGSSLAAVHPIEILARALSISVSSPRPSASKAPSTGS